VRPWPLGLPPLEPSQAVSVNEIATISPGTIAHLLDRLCDGTDVEVRRWLTVNTGFRGRGLRLAATTSGDGAAPTSNLLIFLSSYV
jgi:hypothetical protein